MTINGWLVRYQSIFTQCQLNSAINNNLLDQVLALFDYKFSITYQDLDNLPSGWSKGLVKDLAKEIICGKTPSTKEPLYYGQDIPFITIPDMHDSVFCLETSKMLSKLGAKIQSSKTLKRNNICVSCIGTAGLVSLVANDSQTNQQINSIIPSDNISPFFIYCLMKKMSSKIINYGASGSTFCNLNKESFSNLSVNIPPITEINQFDKIVESYFDEILLLQKENIELRRLRDSLLPKLLSGKIPL